MSIHSKNNSTLKPQRKFIDYYIPRQMFCTSVSTRIPNNDVFAERVRNKSTRKTKTKTKTKK